jgi:N-succinyldiaminopimelate aminotransferase
VRCTDDAGELDVDALRAALSPATCAVLLSHPSNPGGRAYSVGTIARLAEALAAAEDDFGREITLVSDETHRDFTSADTYWSAARSYHRTVIVYSYGKYHFLQGQRLGYAGCSPAHPRALEVAEEMVRWTRISGIATPTALMQRALPYLQDLRHDMSWLGRWRDLYAAELARAGYVVARPNATLFMYVATPNGADDFEFASDLAEAGVLVMPAPVFHDRGHFRIAFTGSPAMLERGLGILRDAAA